MTASMRAVGTTSRLRCEMSETAGLDGMGGTEVDPHIVGSDAETMVKTVTGASRMTSLL